MRAKYFQDYYIANKKRKDWNGRKSHLKIKFGVTPEQYDEVLKQQNFSCAICEKHTLEFEKRLAIDHDHKTGKIRGLLCMFCNTALGKFNDDVSLLKKAINYLETENTGV